MEFEKLYVKMVDAAERAISAMEDANYGQARQILIEAEQTCEDLYIEHGEAPQKA